MPKVWTIRELTFLRKNIHLTDREISEALGRTKDGVAQYRRSQNISRVGQKFERNTRAKRKGEIFTCSCGATKYYCPRQAKRLDRKRYKCRNCFKNTRKNNIKSECI